MYQNQEQKTKTPNTTRHTAQIQKNKIIKINKNSKNKQQKYTTENKTKYTTEI